MSSAFCFVGPHATSAIAATSAAAPRPCSRRRPLTRPPTSRGLREPDVFVDEQQRERRGIGSRAVEAAARAQVVDEPVEDRVERQVVLVLAPRATLRLVGEAVSLPRDREAHLVPGIPRDDALAVVERPAPVVPD